MEVLPNNFDKLPTNVEDSSRTAAWSTKPAGTDTRSFSEMRDPGRPKKMLIGQIGCSRTQYYPCDVDFSHPTGEDSNTEDESICNPNDAVVESMIVSEIPFGRATKASEVDKRRYYENLSQRFLGPGEATKGQSRW